MDIKLLVLTVLIALASCRPHRKQCPASRYLSNLATADLAILKKLQHHYENAKSVNAENCYGRMLRHKPSACDLTPRDSLMVTLEQVSLTVDVLSDMSTYVVSDPVTQALMVFLKMKDDLMTCKESVEHSEPASSELEAWRNHLQHFQDSASPECVQGAVMLNLIPLREDVKCWALSQQ